MSGKYVDMGKEINFFYKGQMHTVKAARSTNIEKVRKALQVGNFDEAIALIKDNSMDTGNLKVKGDKITVKGTDVALGPTYAEAFLYARSMGEVNEALFEGFFVNVAKNPDPRARDGLANFMAHGRLPLTDRGTFLTYRRVTSVFKDPHTGTMDNMIGNVVKMRREDCDSDPRSDCSRGLHVCHHDYSDVGGPYTLVVEVRPQDVVAVPGRYGAKKMRTCQFRVLCTLDYFKRQLLLCEQAALGKVPVFMTEQTRKWNPIADIPERFHSRYKPVDPWEWAKGD